MRGAEGLQGLRNWDAVDFACVAPLKMEQRWLVAAATAGGLDWRGLLPKKTAHAFDQSSGGKPPKAKVR